MYLIGTQMDYVDDELKSEFVFNNPNAKVIFLKLGHMWMWRKLSCLIKKFINVDIFFLFFIYKYK